VPYLSMKLVDRTGSVDARMWGKLPEEFLNDPPGQAYVDVEGHTHEYRGTLQIKIERLRLLPPEDVSEEDYLPTTELDRRALAAELENAGQELRDENLRALFEKMVSDEDFWRAFCEAPAAKRMHHARVGGLLEHSVGCLRIARELAELYPVDSDLLIFGAVFHDVGKVRELSWDRGAFAYTTEGRLLGHVMLGERLVNSYIATLPGFPEDLRLRLSHVLISHQGETEYGSPERPKTLEALLVHLIDNLDARAAMYVESTKNVSPGGWSHHENPLGRALYVPEQ
jgi:3'-5' exoribonuclease